VKPIEEPVRWLDPRSEATDDVRALLSRARDSLGPTDEEMTRLGAFVAGAGAGVGAGAGAGAGAGHLVTKAAVLKLAAILAIAGVGGGVGYSVLRGTSKERRAMTAVVSATSSAAATGTTVAVAEPTPDVAPEETAPPAASAAPVAILYPRAAPPASVGRAPPTATATGTAPPAATAAATVPTAVPAGVGADNPPPVAAPSPGESELALLDRARSRVSRDPASAMRALDEHRARFPGGVFAQEREVLAIEALVRLGRRPDAKARADAFARDFPTSAHRRRIAVLLGESAGD
jgi:hypothetical protein